MNKSATLIWCLDMFKAKDITTIKVIHNMRKWPVWFSLIAFSWPAFYLFHRIGKPEIFSGHEFAVRVVGAIVFSVIGWVVYGIICLLAPSRTVVIKGQKVPKSCVNCKFSEKAPQTSKDAIQNPEDMKCHLTGYNYTADYTCKKWKPQQANAGENLSQKDKDDSTV